MGEAARRGAAAGAGAGAAQEWAHAGFTITLRSALIAHFALRRPEVWGWAAGTAVLWGLSYFFGRRAQITQANA